MAEVQVQFEVWAPLDAAEHGHRCFVALPPAEAVPLDALRAVFPYEGQWHFRSRQLLQQQQMGSGSFVWRDLCSGADRAAVYDGVCMIRAVPISWPEAAEDEQSVEAQEQEATQEEQRYLKMVGGIVDGQPRPARQDPHAPATSTSRRRTDAAGRPFAWDQIRSGLATAQEQLMSAEEQVAKHMKQLWGAVKTTVSTLQGTRSAPLNDSAAENLGKLSDDFSTPPSHEDVEHSTLLESIWTVVFPDQPLAAPSPRWKDLGFQTEDPFEELRRGGVLALRAMAYVMCTYSDRMRAVVQQQKPKTKHNYPFAVVCSNTAMMLADVLKLKDQRFLSAQAGYWQLFEDDRGFFELYSICLMYIDQLWISTNATRSEFGSIITQAKTLAQQLLAADPTSVPQLRQLAREHQVQL